MTFAQATANLCTACCNLSGATDRYKTRDNPSLDYHRYLRSLWQSLDHHRPPAKRQLLSKLKRSLRNLW